MLHGHAHVSKDATTVRGVVFIHLNGCNDCSTGIWSDLLSSVAFLDATLSASGFTNLHFLGDFLRPQTIVLALPVLKNEESMSSKCRFGLHIGLNSVSFAKVERNGSDWQLSSCGSIPWGEANFNPETSKEELRTILQKIARDESVGQESVHLSLHSRYCITRVVTGDQQQVDEQLDEIVSNSHHYLQLGLGENLIGRSNISVGADHQYGQVAIIKRGLIESIENAVEHAGIELEAVDGGLSSACRLAGFAGLDASAPLLLVWLGAGGAEIGISSQGRMQLNYHAGTTETVDQTADTIRKHLKRLKRYCERYRNVDGSAELNQVLILATPEQSIQLSEQLAQLDFQQVYTLQDLCNCPSVHRRLQGQTIESAGVASTLGGLLSILEEDVLPTTDLYENYLRVKPRSLVRSILRDGWSTIATACLLSSIIVGGWWWQHELDVLDVEVSMLEDSFDEEHLQLEELSESQELLGEYQRLKETVYQSPIQDIIAAVATCLPADTRINWFGIDSQGRMILKGTMLEGDRSYEILKALRELPAIDEVALESVGRSTNLSRSATFFEIHCEFAAQSANSPPTAIAVIEKTGGRR